MNPPAVNNPVLLTTDRKMPKTIAIIGAGTIGPDIGYYLKSALADLTLVLIDINAEALDKARARIHAYVNKGLKRGKLSPAQAEAVRQNLITSTDYADLKDCDWVLEAATENLELKKKIFTLIEQHIRPDAIITSNTSSLPAAWLFSHLDHPERATVTHFFAPAFQNPVVEVIDWAGAEPALIAHLRRFFAVTGKVPMVTRDVVCFMLDRIFDNWCNEAALLLDIASPAEIDSVAMELVHAGPFFVLDFAHGNPIIVETNSVQAAEEGDHYTPAAIFNDTDKWNSNPPGTPCDVAPEVAQVIRDRLLGILFSQSVDILDRKIGSPADLDLGCRLAFAFRKGPLAMMAEFGEAEVNRILKKFADYKAGMPQPKKPLSGYLNFYRSIVVDDVDGCKVITLRRPEAMNALHDQMTDEILAVITEFDHDPAVAGFVITGYGVQAFCAGADIGKFPAMLGNRQQSIDYAKRCSRLLVHLDTCPKPVVAALNGLALGGGLELAMRCHALVAVRSAWLQFPEITLGIVPGIGAMVIPYRRWPKAAATFNRMLTRAEKLTAVEAHDIGMIAEIVDRPQDLIAAAVRQVTAAHGTNHVITGKPVSIAAFEPGDLTAVSGQRLSREIITIIEGAVTAAARASSLDQALEIGYNAFGDSACTKAAREGISAFQARRQPDFSTSG
ncbi:MAG: 3-hydroxyacyl-CoA dehydrogenase/enoyl-CoA hydratase family protein [Alphaproteobacteria bacterium]|nr:3-hydroxyacyl-CoA dehydrogenase/enoyl-CoA hydratase family protein [Alphaproteobacteria bacterium]